MTPIAIALRLSHPVAKLWWFVRRPKIVAVTAIVERRGKVLLIRNTYGRTELWHTPGGLKERHEDPGAAAVREVMEETGLVLHKTKHLITERFTDNFRKVTLHVYYGSGVGAVRVDRNEISDAAWFELDRLPEHIGEGTWRAFAALNKVRRG